MSDSKNAATWIPIDKIEKWNRNPRLHPEENLALLRASIRRFGFTRPLIVATYPGNKTGMLIAGHGALAALQALYEQSPENPPVGIQAGAPWSVPVRVVPFPSKGEAEAYGLADNWLAENSKDDAEVLAALAKDLKASGVSLDGLGKQLEDLAAALNGEPEADATQGTDEGPDEPPAEAVSRLGETYELGPHRLVCGDSTKREAWARLLLDGELLQMVWTDPPYGVSYVGKTKDALTIQNDNMDYDGLSMFLRDVFAMLFAYSVGGAPWYVAGPPGPRGIPFSVELHAIGVFRQRLAWVKDIFVLGYSDYHYRHEDIYFGYTKGGGRMGRGSNGWFGDNAQSTVLEFPKPARNADHPTMKPVELVEYCINNSSQPGWVVGEPFGGSGTTLIACAKTGRIARLIELDPGYCDVIRRRWTKYAKSAGVPVGSGGLE